MRNLMLAATAIVGVTALSAGHANAQVADLPVTSDSFAAGTATGATLAPGTITVRLRAQLWVELSYGTDSASKTATGKQSGVLLGSFARLYPKFDAKAANGLEYGATLEVRENNGGEGNAGGFSATTGGNSLYFRRYNGYVGTPAIGRFYFGPENNALARLAAGTTMEDFDYNGGFNGDVPTGNNGNLLINFPYLRGGVFYTTNKLVYLSPSFAGFTVGGSWEPSQSTADQQAANASVVGPQTSSIAGGSAFRRNTFDGAVQYKGSFGPVAITSWLGYIQSGHITDSAATAATVKYKDLKEYGGGARVTIGPFAVGGTANFGDMNDNGNGTLLRQGQRKAQNFDLGAQYTIGPFIGGFQYLNSLSGGNYINSTTFGNSTLHDRGIVIGGAFDYAPGATLYADVLYSQRHQSGWNFAAGAASGTSVGNNGQARAIQVGNTFHW